LLLEKGVLASLSGTYQPLSTLFINLINLFFINLINPFFINPINLLRQFFQKQDTYT